MKSKYIKELPVNFLEGHKFKVRQLLNVTLSDGHKSITKLGYLEESKTADGGAFSYIWNENYTYLVQISLNGVKSSTIKGTMLDDLQEALAEYEDGRVLRYKFGQGEKVELSFSQERAVEERVAETDFYCVSINRFDYENISTMHLPHNFWYGQWIGEIDTSKEITLKQFIKMAKCVEKKTEKDAAKEKKLAKLNVNKSKDKTLYKLFESYKAPETDTVKYPTLEG